MPVASALAASIFRAVLRRISRAARARGDDFALDR
jgi:hypothetical protein